MAKKKCDAATDNKCGCKLQPLGDRVVVRRDESEERFVKMSAIDPNITVVEEYWITSDHTLGNAKAYFDLYEMAVEYALDRVDYRMTLNEDGQKPFIILLNGKAVNTHGQLENFLKGEFKISTANVVECNVKKLYS